MSPLPRLEIVGKASFDTFARAEQVRSQEAPRGAQGGRERGDFRDGRGVVGPGAGLGEIGGELQKGRAGTWEDQQVRRLVDVEGNAAEVTTRGEALRGALKCALFEVGFLVAALLWR